MVQAQRKCPTRHKLRLNLSLTLPTGKLKGLQYHQTTSTKHFWLTWALFHDRLNQVVLPSIKLDRHWWWDQEYCRRTLARSSPKLRGKHLYRYSSKKLRSRVKMSFQIWNPKINFLLKSRHIENLNYQSVFHRLKVLSELSHSTISANKPQTA